jgi:nucleoside-diphosphate-sugar epimerase
VAKRIAVAGYGAVGRMLARRLALRGDAVRIVQRQAPPALPASAEFVRADLEHEGETLAALTDIDTIVCTVGVPYMAKIYVRVWPVIMRNLLTAAARAGARFVLADSLYMYGPQTRPLNEDMPLSGYGPYI